MSAVLRDLCPRCANTGRRVHPAWELLLREWYELHPDTRDEPDEDFVRGFFWARENAEPVPRFIVCGCQERPRRGPFVVTYARIIGRPPYPCAHEPVPESLELHYWIGGNAKARRIPLRRLAAFLEGAEQRFGLRLDEEGGA